MPAALEKFDTPERIAPFNSSTWQTGRSEVSPRASPSSEECLSIAKTWLHKQAEQRFFSGLDDEVQQTIQKSFGETSPPCLEEVLGRIAARSKPSRTIFSESERGSAQRMQRSYSPRGDVLNLDRVAERFNLHDEAAETSGFSSPRSPQKKGNADAVFQRLIKDSKVRLEKHLSVSPNDGPQQLAHKEWVISSPTSANRPGTSMSSSFGHVSAVSSPTACSLPLRSPSSRGISQRLYDDAKSLRERRKCLTEAVEAAEAQFLQEEGKQLRSLSRRVISSKEGHTRQKRYLDFNINQDWTSLPGRVLGCVKHSEAEFQTSEHLAESSATDVSSPTHCATTPSASPTGSQSISFAKDAQENDLRELELMKQQLGLLLKGAEMIHQRLAEASEKATPNKLPDEVVALPAEPSNIRLPSSSSFLMTPPSTVYVVPPSPQEDSPDRQSSVLDTPPSTLKHEAGIRSPLQTCTPALAPWTPKGSGSSLQIPSPPTMLRNLSAKYIGTRTASTERTQVKASHTEPITNSASSPRALSLPTFSSSA